MPTTAPSGCRRPPKVATRRPNIIWAFSKPEFMAPTPDWPKAADWFRKSADAGFADAQYNLGLLYLDGKGVEKDQVSAAELFSKAALQGLPEAAMDYGVLVFRGEGVQKNETVGAQWMLVSARHGNVVAQNRIARLYATGRGVALDPVEAMKWNILATKGGRADPWLDDFAAKQTKQQQKKLQPAPLPSSRKQAKARKLACPLPPTISRAAFSRMVRMRVASSSDHGPDRMCNEWRSVWNASRTFSGVEWLLKACAARSMRAFTPSTASLFWARKARPSGVIV